MLKKDITHIRKERHEITQEDFTPICIVNQMLSMLSYDILSDIYRHVIDNSCGIGNFLVEILKKKLINCKTLEEAKISLKSIYGIELMADNVEECRNRLYNTFIEYFPDIINDDIENFKIRQIIRNRIQWSDALKFNYNKWSELQLKKPDKKHMNISFKENKPSWNTIYPMWMEKPDEGLW